MSVSLYKQETLSSMLTWCSEYQGSTLGLILESLDLVSSWDIYRLHLLGNVNSS